MTNQKRGRLVILAALVGALIWGFLIQAQAQRTVEISHMWGGGEGDSFNAELDRFEVLHPDIKLIRQQTPAGEYRALLMTQFAAGAPPAVFAHPWPAFMGELARAGQLLALDDVWREKDWDRYYSQSWKEMGSYQDQVYGVWIKSNSKSAFWYTVEEFEKLGLTEPKTWDEFLDIGAKFKEAGKPPLITGAKDGWVLTDWFENTFLKVGGPVLYNQLIRHEISWKHPKVVEAFEVIKDLLDRDYFAPDLLGFGFFESFMKRTRGEAGMQLMGGWINGMTQAEFGWKPGIDFTFFTYPIIDPSFPMAITVGADIVNIAKGAKGIEEAKILVDFLASPEAQAIWVERGGLIAPNKLVTLDFYDVNAKKEALALSNYVVVFDLDDMIPTELSTAFRAELQRFFYNPTLLEDVLDTMEAKAQDIY